MQIHPWGYNRSVLLGLVLPAVWAVMAASLMLLGQAIAATPEATRAAANEKPYLVLGMGCFWGAEKRMHSLPGVVDVIAGYAGGDIANPSYETLHNTEAAIDAGKSIKNHAEVVKVLFDPQQTTAERVLSKFWESHDPTQGNRQGADVGSNYRSAIYYRTEDEKQLAEKTRTVYQANLKAAGVKGAITTEIAPLRNYTNAEDYHQDYLLKNPSGYCGLGGTGVAYHDPNNASFTALAPAKAAQGPEWQDVKLQETEQLIAFEAEECGYCKQFDHDVLSGWQHPVPVVSTLRTTPPAGWQLKGALIGTPTIVLFRNRQEIARYVGYRGSQDFWRWLDTSRSAAPVTSS